MDDDDALKELFAGLPSAETDVLWRFAKDLIKKDVFCITDTLTPIFDIKICSLDGRKMKKFATRPVQKRMIGLPSLLLTSVTCNTAVRLDLLTLSELEFEN